MAAMNSWYDMLSLPSASKISINLPTAEQGSTAKDRLGRQQTACSHLVECGVGPCSCQLSSSTGACDVLVNLGCAKLYQCQQLSVKARVNSCMADLSSDKQTSRQVCPAKRHATAVWMYGCVDKCSWSIPCDATISGPLQGASPANGGFLKRDPKMMMDVVRRPCRCCRGPASGTSPHVSTCDRFQQVKAPSFILKTSGPLKWLAAMWMANFLSLFARQ